MAREVQPGNPPHGGPVATSSSPNEAAKGQNAQSSGQVADIVITAQRRSENIQNVPIAISAFSGAQLRASGISTTLALGQVVPNLIAQNNTGIGSANAYYLRGLGNTETIATFDPPVGTYIDDVYISRQNGNNFSLFDVERIEVLRGPQGTLFGRNTTGGAINIIMAQPGSSFGGFAEAGYGSYNKKLARGSVDVPLAAGFGAKVSGYWQEDDGYVHDTTSRERLNFQDSWGGRLGLKAKLGSNLRWSGSYTHIKDNSENLLNFLCDPNNPSHCDGRYAATALSHHSSTPPFAGLLQGPKAGNRLGTDTRTNLFTSRLEYSFAGQTLALITGYLNQDQNYALDFFDGRKGGPTLANPFPPPMNNPRGTFSIVQDGTNRQFSQEVKLNGSIGNRLVDYVGGIYYISEHNKTDFGDVFSISPTTSLVLGDRILRNSTNAIAGYLQGDLNLGEFKLTAGIRYTDEIKKIHYTDQRPSCQVATPAINCLFDQNFFVPANGTTIPARVSIPLRQEAKVWTPRFALNWKPSDLYLFYISATRGFKSGGWNARGYSPQQVLPFSPEKVWSYEGGFKGEFLDRHIRANISAYQMDVTDLQTPSGIVNPANGSITFVTRNFANYRNRGIEGEFTVIPVRGLNLFANFSYSHDKYILPSNAPAFDQYGIQSVASQRAACLAALAAGKIPGGPNIPATQPSIAACGAGIVTASGGIATPVRTPAWTLALGGSYRAPLAGGWSVVPSVAANYRTHQFVATSNFTVYTGPITGTNGSFPYNPFGGSPVIGAYSPGGWLVNAGVSFNAPGDRYQIEVNCTNCFNKSLIQSALVNTTYYNPPAMWEVRARYNF